MGLGMRSCPGKWESHTCPTTQALKEGWSAGMVAISTASPTPITMKTTIQVGQPRSGRRQSPSSVQPSFPSWLPPPNPGGALPRLAPAVLSPSATSNLKMNLAIGQPYSQRSLFQSRAPHFTPAQFSAPTQHCVLPMRCPQTKNTTYHIRQSRKSYFIAPPQRSGSLSLSFPP